MPPFHGENGDPIALTDLPPPTLQKPCFFDQVEDVDRELYMLAIVDEATGAPMRPATEEDLLLLPGELMTSLSPSKPHLASHPNDPIKDIKNMSLQELLAAARNGKGPMCDHCGATESPQWRKGPEEKPILCNACGTRFRRTQQLGPAIPSDQRKRPFTGICAQQAAAAAAHHSATAPDTSQAVA